MTPIAWQDEGGGKWYRRSDGTVRSTVVAERIAHDGYTGVAVIAWTADEAVTA